ncbi:MAG: glycosyltransferase family 4 protein [bacterium]
MRRKTVGLYTPYLDIMGGGEKHILSILKVFDEAGYNVVLFWDTNLSSEIKDKLELSFTHLRFEKDLKKMSVWEKARKLSPLDWLLYVTDGSYFFSPAKKTAIFCMVPDKKLYNLSPLNALKTANAIFIANSHFTAQWLHKWGIRSSVVYPFVNQELFQEVLPQKKPLVLTVGRFFKHLHAKRQQDLIKTFLRFHQHHSNYTLVLAGGVKNEDMQYVEELRNEFPESCVRFKTNISFNELRELYKDASVYWHFSGYGVDALAHPEQVEHLGMTPLEAMASRTVPFCFNAGGPRELIEGGKNGFLFNTEEELLQQMSYFLNTPTLQHHMQEAAYRFALKSFHYDRFAIHVKKIFHIV